MVQVFPSSRNATDALVDTMVDEVNAYAAQLGGEFGMSIQIEMVSSCSAIGFHADCIDAVAWAGAL